MTAPRSPEAGFTLIETLVALAVLAMSAVALLATTEAHVRRVADLEARAAALWTAENHLAEMSLDQAPPDMPEPMLGYRFALTVTAQPTADSDLVKLDIVATDTSDGRSLARMTGFRLAKGAP